MARISFWLASSHWRGWQLSSEDNQHPRGTAPCDQAPWPRRCHSGATWELLVSFTSSLGKNSTKTHDSHGIAPRRGRKTANRFFQVWGVRYALVYDSWILQCNRG